MKIKNTIYIDCSRTYIFGGNTGIQRVVRNIVNNLPDSFESHDVKAVVLCFGTFHIIKYLNIRSGRILNMLKKVRAVIFSNRFGHKILTRKTATVTGGIMYNLFSLSVFPREKARFKKGDVFITTENFIMSFPDIIKSIKDRGVKIGFICHDIFPIRYPEYFLLDDRENFAINLKNSLELSDICISNSEYTKNDLTKYMNQIGINNKIALDSFRLGYDLDDALKTRAVRPVVRRLFTDDIQTFIVVSTIEPRKNHPYILDSFEKVWKKGIKTRLVIIGRVGWKSEETIDRIKTHAEYNKRLFFFDDITDSELNYCYARAKALISASFAEGFGLPIIEAMNKRTCVLASDIPAFREVGGDFCVYFDINDQDSLSDIITKWIETKKEPLHKDLREFKWPDWIEGTKEFLEKTLRCARCK